jgi:flagella basal body P-ring formation protein FlgA
VCKGDNVSITSGSKLIAVKTLGIAQQDGILGDTINVTNQRSGKTVRGRVVGVAAVQTGM